MYRKEQNELGSILGLQQSSAGSELGDGKLEAALRQSSGGKIAAVVASQNLLFFLLPHVMFPLTATLRSQSRGSSLAGRQPSGAQTRKAVSVDSEGNYPTMSTSRSMHTQRMVYMQNWQVRKRRMPDITSLSRLEG